MTTKEVSVNLNDDIHVLLSESGKKILREHLCRGLTVSPSQYESVIDCYKSKKYEGHFCLQMWHFMAIFGNRMLLGNLPPFSMDVYMEVKE
jgi:hypothetical protein